MTEAIEPVGYPFAAVVGLEHVKLALVIGAVEPRLGGVLLRGEKGSAKTTLARCAIKSTRADSTPAVARRASSTWCWHEAHVMPRTGSVSVSVVRKAMIGSKSSRYDSRCAV